MTTHEFAKKLLDGPNIPIYVPKVVSYDDSEECFEDPIISITPGQSSDEGSLQDVAVISYKSPPDFDDDHHSMMNRARIQQSLPPHYLAALLKAAHVLDKKLPDSPFTELHKLLNEKQASAPAG